MVPSLTEIMCQRRHITKRIRKALVTGIAVLALIPTSGAYAADADSTYEGGLLELSRLSDGKKTPSELDQAISEWAEHSGTDKQQILDYELASVTGRIPATTGGSASVTPSSSGGGSTPCWKCYSWGLLLYGWRCFESWAHWHLFFPRHDC